MFLSLLRNRHFRYPTFISIPPFFPEKYRYKRIINLDPQIYNLFFSRNSVLIMPVTISLYICSSSDGFIADKSGGVGWLPPMGDEAQKNYEDYFASVDMVIMGSRSYQKVLSFGMGSNYWPYEGKMSWVFTKQDLKLERDDVKVTSEDPVTFVDR